MKKRSIGDISENKVENLTILPYHFIIFKREIKKLAATFCDDDLIDHNWGLSWVQYCFYKPINFAPILSFFRIFKEVLGEIDAALNGGRSSTAKKARISNLNSDQKNKENIGEYAEL